jgi:hypothetical protein
MARGKRLEMEAVMYFRNVDIDIREYMAPKPKTTPTVI